MIIQPIIALLLLLVASSEHSSEMTFACFPDCGDVPVSVVPRQEDWRCHSPPPFHPPPSLRFVLIDRITTDEGFGLRLAASTSLTFLERMFQEAEEMISGWTL